MHRMGIPHDGQTGGGVGGPGPDPAFPGALLVVIELTPGGRARILDPEVGQIGFRSPASAIIVCP